MTETQQQPQAIDEQTVRLYSATFRQLGINIPQGEAFKNYFLLPEAAFELNKAVTELKSTSLTRGG